MAPERICGAESDTIAALLEDWARSVRDHDINGVLRHHDPDLLVFDVVGPTSFNGLARYRDTWEKQFFPWYGGTGRFELEALDVRAGDRVGFATRVAHVRGEQERAAGGLHGACGSPLASRRRTAPGRSFTNIIQSPCSSFAGRRLSPIRTAPLPECSRRRETSIARLGSDAVISAIYTPV